MEDLTINQVEEIINKIRSWLAVNDASHYLYMSLSIECEMYTDFLNKMIFNSTQSAKPNFKTEFHKQIEINT